MHFDLLAQTESVFALSNGHLGCGGNLDEGEPHGLPGTYLGSFYELRPLPHSELVYGDPDAIQSVVNVTNGKIIRLLVDDEPFDVRYGELRHHERVLDLRAGTLDRTVEWVSPGHRAVRVRSTRLVSFTERAIAAIATRWRRSMARYPPGDPVRAGRQRRAARRQPGSTRWCRPDHPLVAEPAQPTDGDTDPADPPHRAEWAASGRRHGP